MECYHPNDEIDIEAIKNEAEAFYETIGGILCPYFNEIVRFNAGGLIHLKFKPDGRGRSPEEQYARFKLLPLAPRIISRSSTVQGIARSAQGIVFYEFIAVMDEVRVKVIVREDSNSSNGKHFWSIIPFWRKTRNNGTRILDSGKGDN